MSDENEQSLEQKAFEDLDLIHGLADAALVAVEVGDDDAAETVLEEIRSIAKEWEDPDSTAFEDYEPERNLP